MLVYEGVRPNVAKWSNPKEHRIVSLRPGYGRQENDPTPLIPTETEEETLWSQGSRVLILYSTIMGI